MLFTAIRDIWGAFRQYTDQALLFAMAATIIYLVISLITLVVRSIGNKRPYSIWYVLLKTCLFALFGIYISYLVALTLSGRSEGSVVEHINLKAFGTMFTNGRFTVEAFENIVLFVPLGFMIPFVWKYFRGIFRCLLAGFAISVLIEVSQLASSRGFFDIDDIILNSIGTVLGYVLFAGCYDGFLGVKRRLLTDAVKKRGYNPPLGKLYLRLSLQNGLILFVLQAMPVMLWSSVIMGFSGDTGEESGALSKMILSKILKFFGLIGEESQEMLEQSESFLFLEKILRKSAHMFEYAVLAILVWALIYSIRWMWNILSYGQALAYALLVGIIDETNQKSVVGRTGTYKDLFWDMGGAIIAIILVAVAVTIISGYYRKKHG